MSKTTAEKPKGLPPRADYIIEHTAVLDRFFHFEFARVPREEQPTLTKFHAYHAKTAKTFLAIGTTTW